MNFIGALLLIMDLLTIGRNEKRPALAIETG